MARTLRFAHLDQLWWPKRGIRKRDGLVVLDGVERLGDLHRPLLLPGQRLSSALARLA